ncbi:hypothetical protein L7F22_018439 [Adiantum nelumboides]|nr:hypothetical protein [Adiantum nelumboides]
MAALLSYLPSAHVQEITDLIFSLHFADHDNLQPPFRQTYELNVHGQMLADNIGARITGNPIGTRNLPPPSPLCCGHGEGQMVGLDTLESSPTSWWLLPSSSSMKAKMGDVNESMQHRQDKDKKKLVPNVQSSEKVDTKGKAKLVEPNDGWQIPKKTAKSRAPLASQNYVHALEGKGDAHLASSSHANKTLVEAWDRVVHSYKDALLNSATGSSFMRIPASQERHADSHLLTIGMDADVPMGTT